MARTSSAKWHSLLQHQGNDFLGVIARTSWASWHGRPVISAGPVLGSSETSHRSTPASCPLVCHWGLDTAAKGSHRSVILVHCYTCFLLQNKHFRLLNSYKLGWGVFENHQIYSEKIKIPNLQRKNQENISK